MFLVKTICSQDPVKAIYIGELDPIVLIRVSESSLYVEETIDTFDIFPEERY